MSDRSILATSRLHLQILEHLFNKAQLKTPKARWVRLGELLDHLTDECGWGTYLALREGPGRRYTAYVDSVLALLEELGCVERKGYFYRFGRFLKHSDFAPIVESPDLETSTEQETA